MPAPSLNEEVSSQTRSPAPLLHLIEEVLSSSFSYHMSTELADLLERDTDLLAVMQRLVLLVLKHQHTE